MKEEQDMFIVGKFCLDSFARARDVGELLGLSVRQGNKVLYDPDVGMTALGKYLERCGKL